jgi:hypothetical protein
MTLKVRAVNLRESKKLAREPEKARKHRDVAMPLAVLLRQQEYIMLARAKAAISRGGWR